MRVHRFFLVLFLVAPAFSSHFDNMAVQISKDPQLMIEFGSILQSIPELHSLPHPSEMGVAGDALEMYERAFSNFQRLSQTGAI